MSNANTISAKVSVFNQLVGAGVDYSDAVKQAALTPDEIFETSLVDGVLEYTGPENPNSANQFYNNFVDVLPSTNNAQQQQTVFDQLQGSNVTNDWRVRLTLASGSNYLYKDTTGGGATGILAPLVPTNGVIFPYTPQISTIYGANYSSYDLTHSNFRGYFYQNSYVDEITIQASFTAQDTTEANYLLAVIHFFRSASKMFYGQDPNRGVPPPMLFLSGLGDYQFNEHPTLLRSFSYNLPNDVDYIRAYSQGNNGFGTSAVVRSYSDYSDNSSNNRLSAAGLFEGAVQALTSSAQSSLSSSPTYVPTKIDITLSLLPIQTRQQISKQFSLRGYANGDLLKGGLW